MTMLDGRLHCRFEFDGTAYEYHGEGGHYEYKQVKNHAGLSMLQIPGAVAIGDVDAVLAMVWLAKRFAGEDPAWSELAEQMTDPQAVISTIEHAEPVTSPEPKPTPKGRKAPPVPTAAVVEAEPAPAS